MRLMMCNGWVPALLCHKSMAYFKICFNGRDKPRPLFLFMFSKTTSDKSFLVVRI